MSRGSAPISNIHFFRSSTTTSKLGRSSTPGFDSRDSLTTYLFVEYAVEYDGLRCVSREPPGVSARHIRARSRTRARPREIAHCRRCRKIVTLSLRHPHVPRSPACAPLALPGDSSGCAGPGCFAPEGSHAGRNAPSSLEQQLP